MDSETKALVYQMQCVIDGFVFPSGPVQKKKQDAKHAAARTALEILLGVSSLETDSLGKGIHDFAADQSVKKLSNKNATSRMRTARPLTVVPVCTMGEMVDL